MKQMKNINQILGLCTANKTETEPEDDETDRNVIIIEQLINNKQKNMNELPGLKVYYDIIQMNGGSNDLLPSMDFEDDVTDTENLESINFSRDMQHHQTGGKKKTNLKITQSN